MIINPHRFQAPNVTLALIINHNLYETQFSPNFGAKLSSPCPLFFLRLIAVAVMCIVAINVLEPCAFSLESQSFIP
jgi:hypothetical protein